MGDLLGDYSESFGKLGCLLSCLHRRDEVAEYS